MLPTEPEGTASDELDDDVLRFSDDGGGFSADENCRDLLPKDKTRIRPGKEVLGG